MTNILYIIGMPDGPVKIGFTSNLQTRLYTILNSCPFEAKVLSCYEAGTRTPDFERIVHFSLRNRKMRGEWFDIDAVEARAVIERAARATDFEICEVSYAPKERGRPREFSMTKKFQPGRGYSKEDWDAVSDNPEWTEEEIKSARSLSEAMPDLHSAIVETIRKRGPEKTKEAISIRLDMDLVEKLRATGPGWQSRVNDALREWVGKSAA